MYSGTRTVCMQGEGDPGGLLVVGEMSGKVEDAIGHPFSGPSGKYLRAVLQKNWHGPIVYDNAIKCAPGAREVKDKHVNACRPYLAEVVSAAQPKRIVVLGNAAILAVLGRRVPVLSVRRGYGWHFNELDDAIPVFFAVNPAVAMRNRFAKAAFEEDLEWALTAPVPATTFNGVTYVIETDVDAANAVRTMSASKWIAYDVETSGLMHNDDFRIVSLTAMACDAEEAFTWGDVAMQNTECRHQLALLMANAAVGKVTHNGKFDDRAVELELDVRVQGTYADTRLMRRLLEPETDNRLAVIASLVGLGGHKEEAEDQIDEIGKELRYQANPPVGLTPTGKPRKVRPKKFNISPEILSQVRAGVDSNVFAFGLLDSDIRDRYNARDAMATRDLGLLLENRLAFESGLRRVWDDIVCGANAAIKAIESWGFAVDRTSVANVRAHLEQQIKLAEKRLAAYGSFNPNSTVEVRELLFSKLRLRSIKETDSGLDSTDKSVLEALRGKHPVVEDLLTYRHMTKLNGTYAVGLMPHIRADGRVHASFMLDGAGTGRGSSADPNLYNIPRAKGNPEGKMIRDCFVAPPGHVLLEADYSQLELRIAAMLSQDKLMIDLFKSGADFHTDTAENIAQVAWGLSSAQWKALTDEQRDVYRTKAKTVNFGILYGKTAKGLAAEWNCSVAEADRVMMAVLGRFKQLAAWCAAQRLQGRKTGEAWTWWDGAPARRRPLWKIADVDEYARANAENSTVNTPIQGTAADFCTASLWPMVKQIQDDGVPAKIVVTVYDSVVFEVREDALAEVAWMARNVMTGWNSQGVPLLVDMKVGPSWGSMVPYELEE